MESIIQHTTFKYIVIMLVLSAYLSASAYAQNRTENTTNASTKDTEQITEHENEQTIVQSTDLASANTIEAVAKAQPLFALTQHFTHREGGIDGLRGGVNIAINKDGTEVYVAGYGEDSIGIFGYSEARDMLLYRGVIKNKQGRVDDMAGPWDIAISERGDEIYVSAYKDDAINFFKKNSSGDLVFITSYKNSVNFPAGINGPRELVLSPDGKNLYVVNEDDSSITIFSRNIENGSLILQSVLRNGRNVSGFKKMRGIAISPLGDRVYVAAYGSNSLLVLRRDLETGSLRQEESFSDSQQGVDGLFGASTVAVSADGQKVYVAGFKDNALVVFSYNKSNELQFERVLKQGVNGIKGLTQPYKVVCDTKGHVYVSSYGDSSFSEFSYTIEKNGEIEEEVFTQISVFTQDKGGIEGLDGAWGIAAHNSGDVLVTGYKSNALSIFSVDATSNLLAPSNTVFDNEGQTTGLFAAFGVSVSPEGDNVYVNGISDKYMGIFYRDENDKLMYSANVEEGIKSNSTLTNEASPIAVSGITGAWRSSISPDGKNVYVTRYADSSLVLYARDPLNGRLKYIDTLSNSQDNIHGIAGSYDVQVSNDGKNVYVTGFKSNTIAVFNRSEDGMLSLNSVMRNSINEVKGLEGALMLAISPDDAYVYVTSKIANAVVSFARNPSDGSLEFIDAVQDGLEGIDGLGGALGIAINPAGTTVYATGSADGAIVIFTKAEDGRLIYKSSIINGVDKAYGLENAKEIAVSPDSRYLYVTANSKLLIFSLDEESLLPQYHSVFQNGQKGITGLSGAWGLGVSKDSKDVYVTGYYDNSLLVFSRTDL